MPTQFDGYAFAGSATGAAVAELIDRQRMGQLRVVLPFEQPASAHDVYVAAVSHTSEADLAARLATVSATPGLTGVETLPVTSVPTTAPPSYVAVREVVSFVLLRCAVGQEAAVAANAVSQPGVVATAIVAAAQPTVLVEVTADDLATVTGTLQALGTVAGVTAVEANIARNSAGHGLVTSTDEG